MSKPLSLPISRILFGLCIATAITVWRVDVPRDSFGATRAKLSADTENFEHLARSANAQIAPRESEDYLEIVQRPLFDVARRPPETDTELTQTSAADMAATKVSEISNSKLKLLGLVIDQERRAALIVEMESAVTRLVTVGDSVAGWRLEEIDAASATLTKNARTERLTLVRKSDPLAARRIQSALRRRQQSTNAPVTTNANIKVAPNDDETEQHEDADADNEQFDHNE
ncbi:MAG: hypothetical protein O3C28_20330 [Proteobacteria bacterium]|nr:hypothetical protein [Pseudomonadota bacterium]